MAHLPRILFLCATVTMGDLACFAQSAPKAEDPVSQIAATLKPTRQVIYKSTPTRELKLHLFEPKGFKSTDKRPVFVAIHGGGWVGMGPERFYPFAAHFADLGMVGISIEYRLASRKQGTGTTPFECVKDARSAIRYIRDHAAELGIDPGRVIACGGSAGGHLAVSTALFDAVNEEGEPTQTSALPQALVLLFPVIDTSSKGYGNALIGPRWQEIDPLHHVRKGLPPTLVFHGTGDTTTPFEGAKSFHEAMLAAGNHCELVVNEGGKHGYLMRDRTLFDETLQRTEQFLRSHGLLQN